MWEEGALKVKAEVTRADGRVVESSNPHPTTTQNIDVNKSPQLEVANHSTAIYNTTLLMIWYILIPKILPMSRSATKHNAVKKAQ